MYDFNGGYYLSENPVGFHDNPLSPVVSDKPSLALNVIGLSQLPEDPPLKVRFIQLGLEESSLDQEVKSPLLEKYFYADDTLSGPNGNHTDIYLGALPTNPHEFGWDNPVWESPWYLWSTEAKIWVGPCNCQN